MTCIENIVSVRQACDGPMISSSSGYDIMDAPELSRITLASIANNKYITGHNLAKSAVKQAIRDVNSDFLAVLVSNKVQPNIVSIKHQASNFLTQSQIPPSNKERGITLYKNTSFRGSIRKLKISKITVYPLSSSASTKIFIYDNGIKTTYTVQLVANQVNTFDIDYSVNGKYARILIDNTGLLLASSQLLCHVGCNGTLPNDCGYTKGWDGSGEISGKEGFGLGFEFSCECNYEQILCDLSKSFTGKLIYLKARVLLLDERIYSDRNNNWTIYGVEEAKENRQRVEMEYTDSWNTFVAGLGGVLETYRDDCLVCKGIKWKTNI